MKKDNEELYTFGKSETCVILYKSVINTKYFSKVAKDLAEYNKILNELYKIDSKVSINIENKVFNDFKSKAKKYPESFNSFLLNVICSKHKRFLFSMDHTTNYNKRKTNNIILQKIHKGADNYISNNNKFTNDHDVMIDNYSSFVNGAKFILNID